MMVSMVSIAVMSASIIGMVLSGINLELTLMGKQQVISQDTLSRSLVMETPSE